MRDYFKIALQYCLDVRAGVRIAGQLEKLAIKRFLSDLARSGFDIESVDDETKDLLQKLKFKIKPSIFIKYVLKVFILMFIFHQLRQVSVKSFI